jgi:hypothetical protein
MVHRYIPLGRVTTYHITHKHKHLAELKNIVRFKPPNFVKTVSTLIELAFFNYS